MSEIVLRCTGLSKTFRQGKNDVPVLTDCRRLGFGQKHAAASAGWT